MTLDDLKKAKNIEEKIRGIQHELSYWKKELTHVKKLAYIQAWNNNHATALDSSMDKELFDAFRVLAMANLEMQIVELKKDLDHI